MRRYGTVVFSDRVEKGGTWARSGVETGACRCTVHCACVEPLASDRAERVRIDGGEPCSDPNDRAACKRAPAATTARACWDEAEDDVLRVRDAAAAAALDDDTAARAPDDNDDSETGDERPVGLSSVRARMPARRGSAAPAPPTTG